MNWQDIIYFVPFFIVWLLVLWALPRLLRRIGIKRIPFGVLFIISLVIAGLISGIYYSLVKRTI